MFRRANETYRDHRVAGAPVAHAIESVSSFRARDFNTGFAEAFAGERFDSITIREVIEHLDDPRERRKPLRPGTVAVASTPNIGFFAGRLKSALTGEMWGFFSGSCRSQRHISPIPAGQFR